LLTPASFRRLGWLGRTSPSGLDWPAPDRKFSDGRQGQKEQKNMLKMKIDPSMLLKTKWRENENSALANMSMKTSSLSVLPIC
jgi:hypothetical protein